MVSSIFELYIDLLVGRCIDIENKFKVPINPNIIREMKSTSFSPSSLFIICFCLIFYVSVPALCVSLYETVCYEARQDANACLNLLKTDSKITTATNYHDLSKSILNFAFNKGLEAQAYLFKVAKQFPNDQAVGQCANVYYKKSIAYFGYATIDVDKVKDPQLAKNDVQTAGNGPSDCEKAIQNDKGIHDPAIHAKNNEMFLLSEISFLALNHLT